MPSSRAHGIWSYATCTKMLWYGSWCSGETVPPGPNQAFRITSPLSQASPVLCEMELLCQRSLVSRELKGVRSECGIQPSIVLVRLSVCLSIFSRLCVRHLTHSTMASGVIECLPRHAGVVGCHDVPQKCRNLVKKIMLRQISSSTRIFLPSHLSVGNFARCSWYIPGVFHWQVSRK